MNEFYSLETLVFGSNFNQYLSWGCLPDQLKYLEIGYNFNQEIGMGSLPVFLETLVYKSRIEPNRSSLPQSLKYIHSFLRYKPYFEGIVENFDNIIYTIIADHYDDYDDN